MTYPPLVPQPTPETAVLHGFGRCSWDQIIELAENLRCSWADNTGFRLGECPSEAPPYTHLWGWNAGGTVLLRVRIEGPEAVAAVLTRAHGEPPTASADREEVRIVERAALAWPEGEKRIGPQAPGVLTGRIRLIQVLGSMPMTFVRHLAAGDEHG